MKIKLSSTSISKNVYTSCLRKEARQLERRFRRLRVKVVGYPQNPGERHIVMKAAPGTTPETKALSAALTNIRRIAAHISALEVACK